ncbi:MAG TPA: GNAT family N-acetyltransferase [Chitinophagaceae bacterium]|nr:GNAT family N-acetyltransferase [Chitinophagaceae bacterium]
MNLLNNGDAIQPDYSMYEMLTSAAARKIPAGRNATPRHCIDARSTGMLVKIKFKMATSNFDLILRPTEIADLERLFQFQLDKEAGYLAAFMPANPADKVAYFSKFRRLLADPTVNNQTIILNNTIVGSIAKFIMEADAEITYWIDRSCWGQGIATAALKRFLEMEQTRPIYGRVAFDNLASQKVLEKNGFIKVGTDRAFANARQEEIEEFIFKLT